MCIFDRRNQNRLTKITLIYQLFQCSQEFQCSHSTKSLPRVSVFSFNFVAIALIVLFVFQSFEIFWPNLFFNEF